MFQGNLMKMTRPGSTIIDATPHVQISVRHLDQKRQNQIPILNSRLFSLMA
jgi:hypothetical protein